MKTNTQYMLKNALKDCSRSSVAKAMGIQIGSLNNQVAGELPYWPKGSTMNFMDRVMAFIESVEAQTGKLAPLEWMAEQTGCILIRNPAIRAEKSPPLQKVAEIIRDFSAVIDEIGKAGDDQIFDRLEADNIRARWEVMKRVTEEFILACETGIYDTQHK